MLTEKMFEEIKQMAREGKTVSVRMENGSVVVSTLTEDVCMTVPFDGD